MGRRPKVKLVLILYLVFKSSSKNLVSFVLLLLHICDVEYDEGAVDVELCRCHHRSRCRRQ